MTGHFEQGKWIEEANPLSIAEQEDTTHYGIAITIPSIANELERFVSLLGVKPCHGKQWVAFKGNDGNWYSYIDIVRAHLQRIK